MSRGRTGHERRAGRRGPSAPVSASVHAPTRARPAPFGLLALLLLTASCSARGGAATFPEYREFEGREVTDVEFTGTLEPFSADTLEQMVSTQPTRCRLLGLPFCIPFTDIGEVEGHLDLGAMREDVDRIILFYRQSGFFGTRVDAEVDPESRQDDESPVVVTFEVDRADPVILRSLEVDGLEGIIDSAAMPRLPVSVGRRFDLGDFLAAGDTLLLVLARRGHAYAEVLRNYSVDTIADAATAQLVAIPGPVVQVDSIVVEGADQLGRTTVLRQLSFDEGDLLRSSDLQQSQRNLFLLDLVQFASVAVAPDSLQVAPDDSTRATVIVHVTEGPVHVVDAGLGWGSVRCFRSDASWVSRSLGGGARRLAVNGRVSKIGLGGPPSAQVAEGICKAFEDDPYGNELDYRLAAEFTRPYLFNPRNHLSVNAFAERISEPSVYQRTARGGHVSVTRRMMNQDVATLALGAERARIEASDAVFCIGLLVCRSEDIGALLDPRWRIGPSGSWSRDRSDRPIDPREGYLARSTAAWNTPLLGSDLSFVRWSGQASIYREVRPDWVAAGQLRLGTFFGTAALSTPGEDDRVRVREEQVIPPDERFFAGGAGSVRGFSQNALGPGVWVDDDPVDETNNPEFVPVGGTSVATASLELRLPSPFLRQYLRAAAFVDAGAVRTGSILGLTSDWAITPGVGLRIRTPVGPVRIDMAYNPYGAPEAPLFVVSEEGDLLRVEERFRPDRSFLERLHFHIAVGEAF